jgi:hypothetical protein
LTDIGFKKNQTNSMNSKDDMMVKQHASGCIHILDFLYNIQDTMHQGKRKASFIYIFNRLIDIFFTDIKLTITNMIKIRFTGACAIEIIPKG